MYERRASSVLQWSLTLWKRVQPVLVVLELLLYEGAVHVLQVMGDQRDTWTAYQLGLRVGTGSLTPGGGATVRQTPYPGQVLCQVPVLAVRPLEEVCPARVALDPGAVLAGVGPGPAVVAAEEPRARQHGGVGDQVRPGGILVSPGARVSGQAVVVLTEEIF